MNNTTPESQGMMQRASMGSWMLSWLGESWMRSRGELYLNARILCRKRKTAYIGSVLKCGVWWLRNGYKTIIFGHMTKSYIYREV
jgi:hypothetical protein